MVEGDAHQGKILKPDKATKAERAEAVWQMEQALIAGNVIKQNQIEEFYGDVVEEEAKMKRWLKPLLLRLDLKTTAKPGADKTPDAGKSAVEADKADFDVTGEKFWKKLAGKMRTL